MPAESPQSAAGVLIALDALVVQRAEQPTAIDEAPVALRRIGWIGRPIILVGSQVAGRSLPEDEAEREAWVRASIGSGARMAKRSSGGAGCARDTRGHGC
jgi:hypothetical protein